MSSKKNVDTDFLFHNLIGKDPTEAEKGASSMAEKKSEDSDPVEVITSVPTKQEKNDSERKRGRKEDKKKKTQVSLYLTDELIVGLDEQSGIRKKERNKSALACIALELILHISDKQYKRLKDASVKQNKKISQIIGELIDKNL